MIPLKPLNENGCVICTRNEKSERKPDYCADCYYRYEIKSWPLDDLIPISYYVGRLAYSIGAKDWEDNSHNKKDQFLNLSRILFSYLNNNYLDIKSNIKQIFDENIDLITYIPSERQENINEKIIGNYPKDKMEHEYPIYEVLAIQNSKGRQKDKSFNKRTIIHRDKFRVIEQVQNKSIIIIDDIYTSGGTINSAAWTLKNSGANKVFGLVLGRTVAHRFREEIERKESSEEYVYNCKYNIGKYSDRLALIHSARS